MGIPAGRIVVVVAAVIAVALFVGFVLTIATGDYL
jgi:hypothetical protein